MLTSPCRSCQDTEASMPDGLCDDCEWLLNLPNEPGPRILALRKIKAEGFSKIDGYIVDIVTANLLVTCYDQLRVDLREKFETLPLMKLVDACWKAVK